MNGIEVDDMIASRRSSGGTVSSNRIAWPETVSVAIIVNFLLNGLSPRLSLIVLRKTELSVMLVSKKGLMTAGLWTLNCF